MSFGLLLALLTVSLTIALSITAIVPKYMVVHFSASYDFFIFKVTYISTTFVLKLN